jgi:hypothetical protein
LGSATDLCESRSITLHCLVISQPSSHFGKDFGGVRIGRLDHAVMDPLALAPGRNQTCPAKISKMPGNLRLANIQHLNMKADADFVFSHQVDQTQARAVCQRLKKQFYVVFFSSHLICFSGVFDTI